MLDAKRYPCACLYLVPCHDNNVFRESPPYSRTLIGWGSTFPTHKNGNIPYHKNGNISYHKNGRGWSSRMSHSEPPHHSDSRGHTHTQRDHHQARIRIYGAQNRPEHACLELNSTRNLPMTVLGKRSDSEIEEDIFTRARSLARSTDLPAIYMIQVRRGESHINIYQRESRSCSVG